MRTKFFKGLLIIIISLPITAQTIHIPMAWDANSEPDLSHYVLYRDTQSGTQVPIRVIAASQNAYDDQTADLGRTYYYKLRAVDIFGNAGPASNEIVVSTDSMTWIDSGETKPDKFQLMQNYPNPFNPNTTIRFQIPAGAMVDLSIYDITGKKIRQLVEGDYAAGSYTVQWDGKNFAGKTVASGVYYYRLRADTYDAVQRMIMNR